MTWIKTSLMVAHGYGRTEFSKNNSAELARIVEGSRNWLFFSVNEASISSCMMARGCTQIPTGFPRFSYFIVDEIYWKLSPSW
jgi:hypothetical protein